MNIKKITAAVMAVTILAGMTACGNTSKNDATSEKPNLPTNENESTNEDTTTTISELDVDGVKIPVNTTWSDFKTIVEENHWEYIGSTYEKLDKTENPSDSAVVSVKTNLGKITFNFNTKDGEEPEIDTITIDPAFINYSDKVNIRGINVLTKIKAPETKTYNDIIVSLNPLGDYTMIQIMRK